MPVSMCGWRMNTAMANPNAPAQSHQPQTLAFGQANEARASSGVKVYEVDPLIGPRSAGPMEIIRLIEDPSIIKTIGV